MVKKITARLNNNQNFVTIFNQSNSGFHEIESSYADRLGDPSSNAIEFDPDKKLEDDEWFYIEPTLEQKATIIDPYLNVLSSSDVLNPISSSEYSLIRGICLVDKTSSHERIILTRVFPRLYSLSKKILKWEDGPSIESQSSSVEFTGTVHAFWDGRRLYFRSYSTIKPLFAGLEDFYREATEEEKNAFLEKDYFECSEDIQIKKRNLRRIASVLGSIDWNDSAVKRSYIDYAQRYPDLGVVISADGKIRLDSNQDVTNVMNILEERIYTTPITGEIREAHAITKLG